jgi:PadR family transcriptional regulator, regulatory protein PadR
MSRGAVVGTDTRQDLLQGTLDLLVLKVLSVSGDMHGWGIAQAIQRTSRETLQVNQGSLYPSLHRLERRGLLHAEWGTSENNRSAKYYRLTAEGRRALAEQTADWERVAGAVRLILRMA